MTTDPTAAEWRLLLAAQLSAEQMERLINWRARLITSGRVDNRLATRDTLRHRHWPGHRGEES